MDDVLLFNLIDITILTVEVVVSSIRNLENSRTTSSNFSSCTPIKSVLIRICEVTKTSRLMLDSLMRYYCIRVLKYLTPSRNIGADYNRCIHKL